MTHTHTYTHPCMHKHMLTCISEYQIIGLLSMTMGEMDGHGIQVLCHHHLGSTQRGDNHTEMQNSLQLRGPENSLTGFGDHQRGMV